MIRGVHFLLYSRNPEADRAFFRDVLGFPFVDSGEGWLIFGLPPAEMGIHPTEADVTHQHAGQELAATTLYLMCEDLNRTLDELKAKGIADTEVQEAEWGVATSIRLPGGGVGLYEPHHPLAIGLPHGE